LGKLLAQRMETKITAEDYMAMQAKALKQLRSVQSLTRKDGAFAPLLKQFSETALSAAYRIIPQIREWQCRPLESIYNLVWLDALQYKVKDRRKWWTGEAKSCH